MNKWLVGNGYWCTACKGTGRGQPLDAIEYKSGQCLQFYAPCASCKGQKRLAATPIELCHGSEP